MLRLICRICGYKIRRARVNKSRVITVYVR